MKTRCPCCGAENSLDALIAHEEARQLLWTVAQIGGGLSSGLLRYLGLFRPPKSALSQARMAALTAELLPMMQSGEVRRDGKRTPAPLEAWRYGFEKVLSARETGCLKTPLKSHGYLLEIVGKWQPPAATLPARAADGQTVSGSPTAPASRTVGAVAALEEMLVQIGNRHDP